MTQQEQDAAKIAELNTLFLALNNGEQTRALTILKALKHVQCLMYPTVKEDICDTGISSNHRLY